MNPKHLARWREQRKQGRTQFVLRTGMLAYGLPMFALLTFILPLMRGRAIPSPLLIAISAVLWTLGGAIFGVVLWAVNERNYKKAGGE